MWSEKSSNVLWILILNTKDVKFINAVMLKSRGKMTTGLKLRIVKSINVWSSLNLYLFHCILSAHSGGTLCMFFLSLSDTVTMN